MNARRTFSAALAGLLYLSGNGFAGDNEISTSEPVILQCQRDGICPCRELGGDVYKDGLKIRCVFINRSVKSTYAYFKKFHTPELSRFLTTKIPSTSKHWTTRDISASENIEINYTVGKNTPLKIQIDFMNGGYGYIFTPQAGNTALEFLYTSYN